MKVISLFDGISCARVALRKVGIEPEQYFASEIDQHAISVAQRNFPDSIQVGSVKDVNGKTLRGGGIADRRESMPGSIDRESRSARIEGIPELSFL